MNKSRPKKRFLNSKSIRLIIVIIFGPFFLLLFSGWESLPFLRDISGRIYFEKAVGYSPPETITNVSGYCYGSMIDWNLEVSFDYTGDSNQPEFLSEWETFSCGFYPSRPGCFTKKGSNVIIEFDEKRRKGTIRSYNFPGGCPLGVRHLITNLF